MGPEGRAQPLLIDGVDAEVTLDQLLPAGDRQRLVDCAAQLLACPVRLCSLRGEVLAGGFDGEAAARRPLSLDFEPLVLLECAGAAPGLEGVVRLLDWWLGKQLKYVMTASLHHAVVESDYVELERRNEELAASETRYRELAEKLEVKVREQVQTIKQADRQLYEQEKLASVGQLAAGMAHEINNPLGFVTSNLRMAAEYVGQLRDYVERLEGRLLPEQYPAGAQQIGPLFEDFGDLLQESLDGCERVAVIVRNLKEYSNVDGTDLSLAAVDDILRNVVELHRARVPEAVQIRMKLAAPSAIELSSGHLAQVFSNLFTNALDAVKAREEGWVSLTTEETPERVELRIADNGAGMNPETRQRAFEPFFTTKPVGQGTGLGLTVCRDVVLAHGGSIRLRSDPGRGTLVSIRLPRKRPR